MTQRKNRRSLMALAGAGLALTLSVTGCSFDFSVGDADPVAVQPEETDGHAGASTGDDEPPESPQGGDGRTAVCTPDQLIAELHEQQSDSAQQVLMILTLSNGSEQDCRLPAGWAPLGQGGAGGPHYMAVEGTRDPHPNPGVEIILPPGATAYAGLMWETDPQCPSAGGWAVSWQETWLPAQVTWQGAQRDICPNTFTQGTLQIRPNEVNYG